MSATTTDERPRVGVTELARRGAWALVVALAANWLVTFVATAAGVAPDLAQLDYAPVGMLTTVGVVATVTYGVLALVVADPDRAFVAVAAVVLPVSLVPDVLFIPTVRGGSLAGGVVLGTMHVVTAAVCVAVLTDLRERGARGPTGSHGTP